MGLFTIKTLLAGLSLILAGVGSLYISISIKDLAEFENSWGSWLLIAIFCWVIGTIVLVGDVFYNRRNRRTLVHDKLLWFLAIFFLMITLGILSMGVNAINNPNSVEHEYWKGGIYGAIIPIILSAVLFYFIMKGRKTRAMFPSMVEKEKQKLLKEMQGMSDEEKEAYKENLLFQLGIDPIEFKKETEHLSDEEKEAYIDKLMEKLGY